MKALRILEEDLLNSCSLNQELYILEAIKEIEEFKNRGCIGCINLRRSNSQDCISCSRQYQDNFKIAKNKQ